MVLKRLMRCCCIKHAADDDMVEFGGGNVHALQAKRTGTRKSKRQTRMGKSLQDLAKLTMMTISFFVVANFSASWCGPCRVISPVYAEMSQTYPQLMFLTIDADDLVELSKTWGVRATPTFFLKNGQQVDKLVGANKAELQKKVVGVASAEQTDDACDRRAMWLQTSVPPGVDHTGTFHLFMLKCHRYPQLMFLTIDADDLMELSDSWDIRAIPTFFFLKNGQQVDKLVGANKAELQKKVAAVAGQTDDACGSRTG
ncbi:thioredoxin H4-1-like [Panicum miliaceum]|uniref:Thioredoxin H4-1-like n=1 Tax=Panicum miliaceum TaxID=4540 RepID=A0A3L6QZK6_PANMI|nr:thioredoxin H4-1-like [Panicum miliaceum]